jgi:hypothetical protein
MKDGDGSGVARERRFNFTLCSEISHFLMEELDARKWHGLPHAKLNDIAEEWMLGHALHIGYEIPGHRMVIVPYERDDSGKPARPMPTHRKPRRFNFTFVHELSHFLIEERDKRIRLGLPNAKLNDIAEEWLLGYAVRIGYKLPTK